MTGTDDDRKRWLALYVLCTGVLMIVLDVTVVNVALPSIQTGLHIGTTVGRLSVCAEAVAFGRALLDGDGTIQTAVAVRHPKPEEENRELAVVPPCGACREMILDHAPDAMIIVKDADVLIRLPIRTLLPLPYRR